MIDLKRAKEIANDNYKKVFAYCLSNLNCNNEDAAEVTQEVFLFFQQKIHLLEDNNITSWLYSVAKNKVHEYFRKAKKQEQLISLEENLDSLEDILMLFDQYFVMTDEEIEKSKEIILKTLKPKEFELYTKIYVEKKKYSQVAKELNISEKAVSVYALRLRNKIKRATCIMLSVPGQFIIRMFF